MNRVFKFKLAIARVHCNVLKLGNLGYYFILLVFQMFVYMHSFVKQISQGVFCKL